MKLVHHVRHYMPGLWPLVKETFVGWWEDKAPRLGASLAYYTVLALAPVIILLTPMVRAIFGPRIAGRAIERDELNLELQDVWLSNAKTVLFVTHSISEAVFLADRVLVMSRSPGRIVDVIPVDLPRPRTLSVRETPAFTRYVAHIRQLFESFGILRGTNVRYQHDGNWKAHVERAAGSGGVSGLLAAGGDAASAS